MAQTDIDAVVIGSGAGGGAVAWGLARYGFRTLVLEAGPLFVPPRDYRQHTSDWERIHFPQLPGSQGRYVYAPLQKIEPSMDRLRSWNSVQGKLNPSQHRQASGYHHVRGVGGTTLHFTGEAHRLHPDSMKMRSRFGIGADWPLDYAELEPFYAEVERVAGVAGPQNTAPRWRSAPYPMPAHPASYA